VLAIPSPSGEDITFGRGSDVMLRIGHAPLHDEIVPRLTGSVFACRRRVVVANLDDALAFDIRVADRALVSLSPGAWHSPDERYFDIVIVGTLPYTLSVMVNTEGNPTHRLQRDDDPALPRTGGRPVLTERQRRILDAYVAPMYAGGPPASHQQVADALRISRALVRVECHRIWSELFLAGVPMRDLGDARDEIADAWARHRI
jgi:hypothetical protein